MNEIDNLLNDFVDTLSRVNEIVKHTELTLEENSKMAILYSQLTSAIQKFTTEARELIVRVSMRGEQ